MRRKKKKTKKKNSSLNHKEIKLAEESDEEIT